jgi:hypothetical protein
MTLSSSVPDPELDLSQVSGSGSGFGIRIQEGKNDPTTKIEKSEEISCFEVQDVLF